MAQCICNVAGSTYDSLLYPDPACRLHGTGGDVAVSESEAASRSTSPPYVSIPSTSGERVALIRALTAENMALRRRLRWHNELRQQMQRERDAALGGNDADPRRE